MIFVLNIIDRPSCSGTSGTCKKMEKSIPSTPLMAMAPLFSGPLPFGSYYHEGCGNVFVTTRQNRKYDQLYVDDIWPGSIYIADYLNTFPFLCYQKNVLELGAGASLPSIVSGKLSSNFLTISDYPDEDILENIQQGIHKNNLNHIPYRIIGYKWGDDVSPLLIPLTDEPGPNASINSHYDLILLAEVLWKDTYCQQRNLLFTIKNTLKRKYSQSSDLPSHLRRQHTPPSILLTHSIALMSFMHRPTPSGDHRPEHDLEFFQIAKEEYQLSSLLLESREDPESGDLVYLYCLYHEDDS